MLLNYAGCCYGFWLLGMIHLRRDRVIEVQVISDFCLFIFCYYFKFYVVTILEYVSFSY